MSYYDQHLTCSDCNRDFLWSAREQEFFAEKGFQQPKRCKECKQRRKEQQGGGRQDDDRGNRR